MRAVVLALGLVLAACGGAPATSNASPAPVPTGTVILTGDGGVLRPIANGSRIPLKSGWAVVKFDPFPIVLDGAVVISLFDTSGKPVEGEVTLSYQSLDMDHGTITEHGKRRSATHRLPLELPMPGAWKLTIGVARSNTTETVAIVLPSVP